MNSHAAVKITRRIQILWKLYSDSRKSNISNYGAISQSRIGVHVSHQYYLHFLSFTNPHVCFCVVYVSTVPVQILTCSITMNLSCCSFVTAFSLPPCPSPQALENTHFWNFGITWICYINKINHMTDLWDWLFLLSINLCYTYQYSFFFIVE